MKWAEDCDIWMARNISGSESRYIHDTCERAFLAGCETASNSLRERFEKDYNLDLTGHKEPEYLKQLVYQMHDWVKQHQQALEANNRIKNEVKKKLEEMLEKKLQDSRKEGAYAPIY